MVSLQIGYGLGGAGGCEDGSGVERGCSAECSHQYRRNRLASDERNVFHGLGPDIHLECDALLLLLSRKSSERTVTKIGLIGDLQEAVGF